MPADRVAAPLEAWRSALEAWAIPDAILDAAPESPWGLPPELFRRRAEGAVAREPSVLVERALETLPERGTVLDVGVGGGATSLPLAGRASRITGVDGSEGMLESFREAALAAGVEAVGVLGTWPDVAPDVEPADAVVSGHVLYNVADLGPFALALTTHARRRVVVEITGTHPLAWMGVLWHRFHALDRPDSPTGDDAEAALRALGLDLERHDRGSAPRSGGFERREDAIALVRRRLCLPSDRDRDIADALGEHLVERDGRWSAGPSNQTITTMWWNGTSG
ncbi:MAG: class I SAM-dependent methyltransferase [Actinomycetota bacterium]